MSFSFSEPRFFYYGKHVPILCYVQLSELCSIGARSCFSAGASRQELPVSTCQGKPEMGVGMLIKLWADWVFLLQSSITPLIPRTPS